jgi:hypothetical protein
MNKIVNLTPENFVDIFILCLSWQWNPVNLTQTFTTVDKVLKILQGLGVVTEAQINMVHHPRSGLDHQRWLRRQLLGFYKRGYLEKREEKEVGTLTELAQEVLSSERMLCVLMRDVSSQINLARLVRDTKIHLTYKGAGYAETLADKFSPFFTKEAYKAEELRREMIFSSQKAHACAAAYYRNKVVAETCVD